MSRFLFAVRLKLETPAYKRGPSTCCHCGKPAYKAVIFKEPDILITEPYCDSCLMDPVKFQRLQAVYERVYALSPSQ